MKKRKANIGRKSNDAKHTRKSRQKKKMLQKDPKITASSGSTTSGQWKRKSRQKLWTDQLMDSIAEEEDVVVEKIEETEILAPKVQEFQSPEVEQPNDDEELEMQASAGGSSGLYQATPPLQGGQDLHDNDGHHQNQLGATNPNCLYDAQTCEDELEDKNQIIDEVLTKMEKFNSSDLSRVLTKVADLMKNL